jgi:hypothetical protein
LLPRGFRLELQSNGREVDVRLVDRDHRTLKEISVLATDITSRGFDLLNVSDNDGRILPQQLAQYLADLVL